VIVAAQRLARLVCEDSAFRHHDKVEPIDEAGIELDASGDVLQPGDGRAESRVQPTGLPALLLEPRGLQRADDAPIAQHRTEHRHRLLARRDAHLGLAEHPCEQWGCRGWLLRHTDFENGLNALCWPGAQTLEPLDTAERQSQGSRVWRDILLDLAAVEQRDVGIRHAP